MTFTHSVFFGLRYVVWFCGKGRKGRGLCLPPVGPYGRQESFFGCSAVRSLAEELVWSVRGLWQHAHQGTLVAERVRQRPGCAAESWEYWPATGATAALPICTGVRHVVEEVHLSGGFVLINSIGFNMVRFVRPVRKGRDSIPI